MRKNRSGGQSRGSPVTHIASHSGKIGQVGALVQSLYYGSVSIKCTVFSNFLSVNVLGVSTRYIGGNQYYFINGMS